MEQSSHTEPILKLEKVSYQYRNQYTAVDAVKDVSTEF